MKSIIHCEINANTVEKRPAEALYDGTTDFVDIAVPLATHETVVVREVELWNASGDLWDRYTLNLPVTCTPGTVIRMRAASALPPDITEEEMISVRDELLGRQRKLKRG